MVRKVVIPATISVLTLVLFSLSLNIRSSICVLPPVVASSVRALPCAKPAAVVPPQLRWLSRRSCDLQPSVFVLLSPLGGGLGEGAMQEVVFGLTPSPNLSPKGERNMNTRASMRRRGGEDPEKRD